MMDDYITLEQVSPGLTNEKITTALTAWFGHPFIFTYWEHTCENDVRDSYLSEIMRIKIYGTDGRFQPNYVQVFLKHTPKSVAHQRTFRSDDFFKNEISFYEKVLPVLLKFQSTKDVKDPCDKFAKLLFTFSDGSSDAVCLEDASVHNYRIIDRPEDMDLEHCKVTLKVLAQFHAISFAMKDQQPEEFEKIKSQLFETYYHERLREWYKKFWDRICKIAIDAVEKEYPNSIYVEKVKQFAVPERYDDLIAATCNTQENGVILHGDCWLNNYLYKYSDGCPIDARIVDFQLARCASPVLDISSLIYSSTCDYLRVHHDDLLKYYYDILSTQIKEMGTDPNKVYSWDTFMSEMKKYSFFGLAFSFETTPLIFLSPAEGINMEILGRKKLDIDDVLKIGPLRTKGGRQREAGNVKHCVDMGYI